MTTRSYTRNINIVVREQTNCRIWTERNNEEQSTCRGTQTVSPRAKQEHKHCHIHDKRIRQQDPGPSGEHTYYINIFIMINILI